MSEEPEVPEFLFPKVTESRVYEHHTGCRQATEVNGNDFMRLCDPLENVPGTMCTRCGRAFAFKNFRWVDTQEVLSDYRIRLKQYIPPEITQWYKSRFWFWGIGISIVVSILLFVFMPNRPNGAPEERLYVAAVASVGLLVIICYACWSLGGSHVRQQHRTDYRRVR